MLTFHHLRNANISRCAKWHGQRQIIRQDLDTGITRGMMGWSLSDWYTACSGELGETGNVIKKLNRVRDGLVGNQDASLEELRQQLGNEIADTLIYLDLLAASAGIDLSDVVIRKFNEVSDRNGFSERL